MSERETFRVSFVRLTDGTTTCCDAYSTIFIDDGIEYCKGCGNDIEGHLLPAELLAEK